MERTYEGLFILDTAGKEEGGRELVEKLEKDLQKAGGQVLKIERMDKRPFARVARKLESGYYVNIVFEMAPEKLAPLRRQLRLDEAVFRAVFMRAGERPVVAEPVAA